MKNSCVALVVLTMIGLVSAVDPPSVRSPYETERHPTKLSQIDRIVQRSLKEQGVEPANPCSDEVFVRRVYLDVIGTLPSADEVRAFLADERRVKRSELIESLFERDEFADYWTLKWCDLLRVKSEFPINLWPNAVQAYERWIHDSVAKNKRYDEFARELLTSSGSNFRVPPVNFYRAIQGKESGTIASAVALMFMGTRLEHWPEEERHEFEQFFTRIAFKGTAEWKEEIVFKDPAPIEPFQVTFPDGTTTIISSGEDPRVIFADWLIDPKNEWFARNLVNRIWSWLMGRGIIHEPDDIRPDNPVANPMLLQHLEKEFVRSRFDIRHVFRIILNSRAYQQSPIAGNGSVPSETMYAHYQMRRLDAEVLIDALCQISGPDESYQSAIPEPFTFIPEAHRSITLADGSITSPFLEMFGRPARHRD